MRGALGIVLAHHLHLHDPLQSLAEGPHRARARRIVGEAAFHCRVPFVDLDIEALFEVLPDRDRGARADDLFHRIVRIVRPSGLAVYPHHHAAEQGERRAAVFSADVPEPALGELAADDGRDAEHERGNECDGLGVAVGEGQTGIELVGIRVAPDKLGEQLEHGHPVPLDEDSLGVARGPGCIDDFERRLDVVVASVHRRHFRSAQDLVEIPIFLTRGRGKPILVNNSEHLHTVEGCKRFFHLFRKFAGENDSLGRGVLYLIAQLASLGPGIDGHDHSPQHGGGSHAVEEFRMVSHDEAERVASADARIFQTPRDLAGVHEKVSVRQRLVPILAVFKGDDGGVGRFFTFYHQFVKEHALYDLLRHTTPSKRC